MKNKLRLDEKTRKFDFRNIPVCKHMKKVKLSNGLVVEVCLARKGVGRMKQYCSFAGQYPMCPHYLSKYKWGRSLYDVAGDFLGR